MSDPAGPAFWKKRGRILRLIFGDYPMKKTLMLATAVAMFAAPAFAQVGAGTTYSDNQSTFQVNAPVSTFCKFGNVGNTATVSGGGTTGNDSFGNGATTGDQAFVVNIQNPADNTVQAASGSFTYAQAQCNTLYTVTTTSANSGLKTDYNGPTASAFATIVPYQISFHAVNQKGAVVPQNVASTNTLVASGTPFADSAFFDFSIPASGLLLLAGTYRDEVRLTMSPLTSGPSI